jgi:hypothetical protein
VGHATGAADVLDIRPTDGTASRSAPRYDAKFTGGFDAVFEAEHIRIARTPIHAPQAIGIAERFVRTARSECLDWLLILNARHLERTLTLFFDHLHKVGDPIGAWTWRHKMVGRFRRGRN